MVPWMARWTVAYLVAVLLSRLTYVSDMPVAQLWPAGGVALGWAVSGGLRRLPWVAVGVAAPMTLHGLLLSDDHLAVSLFAVAHAGQSVAVGGWFLWLRRRTRRPVWPEDTRGLVALTACALAGAVAVVPLVWWGTTLLYGVATPEVVAAWVLRNTVSTLVVGVPVLELIRARRSGVFPGNRPTRTDLAVLGVGVGATALLLVDSSLVVAVPFAVMALLVWVGSRMSPLWAALVVCLLVALATAALVQHAPPFATIEGPMTRTFVFQVFMGLAALTTLALSQAGRDRARLTGELARSHQDSSRRARMLQAVAGAMTEEVLVYDEDHQLVWSNTDLAGDTAEGPVEPVELRGLDGRPVAPAVMPWARAFAGEPVTGARFLRERIGGPPTVVEVSASLLADREEAEVERLVVVVVRDVTDQHRSVEDLRSFAGAVAHDLKTPLTGLLGFAQSAQAELEEMAADGLDVASVRRLIGRSEAAGQRMDRLIGDLLDLSASDRTQLHPTPLDLTALAGQVAVEVREAHPEARIDLPAGPVHARADPRLVRQLLRNLMGNAVKYAVPGEQPQITVTLRSIGDRVLVAVADRGVGIPPGEEALVFEPFRRASNHGGVAGSGLGLATCARAVERHGGHIAAAPHDGGGTVVTFDLPASEHRSGRTTHVDEELLSSPPRGA